MKVHVHQMNLMKNQIIQKKFNVLKFWRRRSQGKTLIFLIIWQKIMFNGFKMSNFRCKSHVQEIILPNKCLVVCRNSYYNFLGFFTFLVINQNIYTQLCMNVKTHHHQMYYFKLEYKNFVTSKFVSNKCYLQKITPQKSWNPFPFFLEPQPWINPMGQ